ADQRPLPEDMVAAAEDGAHLRGCLSELDEVPRRIVSLRIIEDVSGSDVARLLDLTPGHVAVLLPRANKALASCLAKPACWPGSRADRPWCSSARARSSDGHPAPTWCSANRLPPRSPPASTGPATPGCSAIWRAATAPSSTAGASSPAYLYPC